MSKPKVEKIRKHLEVKTYTHLDVAVHVRINYDTGVIDLLDNAAGTAKRWIFAGRSVSYMEGWRNILEAMEYAITDAEKDLRCHQNYWNEQEKKRKIALGRAILAEKE